MVPFAAEVGSWPREETYSEYTPLGLPFSNVLRLKMGHFKLGKGLFGVTGKFNVHSNTLMFLISSG